MVAALAACSHAQASALGIQFGIEGLHAQAYLQPSLTTLEQTSGVRFGTNFSGQLVTTSTASTMLEGSNSLGGGWTLASFFATQTFVNGAITGGNIALVANHVDGYTDSFEATLKDNSGGQNITGNRQGLFHISSEFESVTLSGLDSPDLTFAGLDLSSAHMKDWLGSFLRFDYAPNNDGLDGDMSAAMQLSVIPLPAPVLMALTGLLPVVVFGLRRRSSSRRSLGTNAR